MITTKERITAPGDTPSRRIEEILELEAAWAASTVEFEAPPSYRALALGHLQSRRIGVAFAAVWLAFLTVLLVLGPSGDAAATPAWVENTAGVMLTALLLAPLGIFNRAFGYGASSVAGICGVALAVGCFTSGHTGFWSSYQLVGFGVLAVASVAIFRRSVRR